MFTGWHTVAAFVILLLPWLFVLWRWHRDEGYKKFDLMDLIAEDGKLSARKFMEVGSWQVATVILIVMTDRGTVSEAFLLTYCATFSGARLGGQIVHAMAERRTAAYSDPDDRPIARPKARASLFR